MQIVYVGPFESVDFLDAGNRRTAVRGTPIDVSPDLAGKAPDPRIEAAHLEHRAAVMALDHNRAKALEAEIVGLDYGSGLLAQAGNWQPVAAPKAAKAAKDGE
jgi:hypothetical protein